MNTFYSFNPIRFGLLYVFVFLLFSSLHAQDHLSFKKIVKGPTPAPNRTPDMSVAPEKFEADVDGGSFYVNITYKKNALQNCTARYLFDWQFSSAVNQLKKGQPVQITYTVTMVEGPCPAGKAKMVVNAASGFSDEFKSLGVRHAGGISVKPARWIEAGVNGKSKTAVATLDVFNPKVKNASLRLAFESTGYVGSEKLHYELVYLFEGK